MAKIASALLALCFGLGNAFIPGVTNIRALSRAPLRDNTQTFVTRLSEIDDGERKEPAWKKFEEENAGFNQEPGQVTPTNYEGLVDGDGFDGGDGQVGVVGDGSNAMETFDKSGTVKARIQNSVGGSESKKTQKNVFGMTTGYADELKEQGMVQLDETGGDMLQARRQQLENWRNQRELKAKQNSGLQELSDYTGVEYDARRATQSYFNALDAGPLNDDAKFTITRGDAKQEAATEAAVLDKGDITETIHLTAQFPSPCFHEISVKNDVISFEEFVVGFSDDSVNGGADYQVKPLSGELNGRRGDPTPLSVTFKPNAPGGPPRTVYLVVQTEESKFTYEIIGNVA